MNMNNETENRTIYNGWLQPTGFPSLPQGWNSQWDTFPSSCGKLKLFSVVHHHEPWENHRALVVLHGQGEHSGRYLHFPHYLQNQVDSIFCMDHRGHGRSEGGRGHADHFDLYVDDAAQFIEKVDQSLKKRFGKSEIHLLGHSMGGLIALRLSFLYPDLPIVSSIISAPLLGLALEVPLIKKTAAYALCKVWGSLQLSSGLDLSSLSHNRYVQEAYSADRLVHNKATPKFFVSLQEVMADTLARKNSLDLPLQMMIPLEDKLVSSDASLDFYQKLECDRKKLITYQGYRHEIFNEGGVAAADGISKEIAFADLNSWLETHHASV